MPAEVIQGTVLLAGVNAAGEPVLLKLNDDGALSGGGASLGSTPSTQAMGDVAAGGSDTTASKNDHKHGMPSFGGAGVDIGVAAAGVATTPSRSDHVHAIPDQLVTSRMVTLTQVTNDVVAQETSTSTSYTDLATVGPTGTLSPGVVQNHLIILRCYERNSAGGQVAFSSIAINGAAAAAADECKNDSGSAAVGTTNTTLVLATAQPNGASHVAKYKVNASTGTWGNRRMVAVAL